MTNTDNRKATPMNKSTSTELISVVLIGLLYSAGFAFAIIAPYL